jgi:hypothetical protein
VKRPAERQGGEVKRRGETPKKGGGAGSKMRRQAPRRDGELKSEEKSAERRLLAQKAGRYCKFKT